MQTENLNYSLLSRYFEEVADKYNLDFINLGTVFEVDSEQSNTIQPGIKVHSLLTERMFYTLIDPKLLAILKQKKIDGIKIYENPGRKQVTFYIGFQRIGGYKELINVFKANKITIRPSLYIYGNSVLINRMYIANDIFVRFSPDFSGKIDDIYKDPRMTDYIWREAEDRGIPRIWAVSRSYLLSNLDKLNFASNTDIITFLTLTSSGVPIPNVVLAYDRVSKTLKVFPLDKLRVVEYNLQTISKIASDHPVQRLTTFLS
jgi:hypothetical protein